MKTIYNLLKCLVTSILGICIRLILFIVIVFTILFIIDKSIYILNKAKETPNSINLYHYALTQAINDINGDKLRSGYWNYKAEDYTIINAKETIPDKGDKKRILVVGDSFVWGWGHNNINNVWWKQLGNIIKQNGYQNVDIVAAGMNGFSIVDETEKIILNQKYITQINPDLIIIGFVSNDWEIMDAKDEYYVSDISIKLDKHLYMKQHYNINICNFFEKFFGNLYEKVATLILEKEYAKEEFQAQYGYTHKQKKLLYHTEDYIKRIRDKAIEPLSNINLPLLVVNLHYESETGNSSFQFKEDVFELLNEFEVENYDLHEEYTKEFKDISYEDLQVTTTDFHPGTRLMNFYAKRIYNYLEQNHNNILGQKSNISDTRFEINDYLPYTISLQKIIDKKYKFQYHPHMPTLFYYSGEKYIKLNLENPVHIKKILLEITELSETTELSAPLITVNFYNETLGYEDKRNIKINLDTIENNKYLYTLNINEKITAINISWNPNLEKRTEVILEFE